MNQHEGLLGAEDARETENDFHSSSFQIFQHFFLHNMRVLRIGTRKDMEKQTQKGCLMSKGTKITCGSSPEQKISVDALREGREAMARRCEEIAARHTPEGWTVRYRNSLTGCCNYEKRLIETPKPRTRRALHIYLHEVAHAVLHANSRKASHVQEYEAETWAFRVMREEGIAVPRKSLEKARAYVRRKIDMAVRRGAKRIDAAAKDWAKK